MGASLHLECESDCGGGIEKGAVGRLVLVAVMGRAWCLRKASIRKTEAARKADVQLQERLQCVENTLFGWQSIRLFGSVAAWQRGSVLQCDPTQNLEPHR